MTLLDADEALRQLALLRQDTRDELLHALAARLGRARRLSVQYREWAAAASLPGQAPTQREIEWARLGAGAERTAAAFELLIALVSASRN